MRVLGDRCALDGDAPLVFSAAWSASWRPRRTPSRSSAGCDAGLLEQLLVVEERRRRGRRSAPRRRLPGAPVAAQEVSTNLSLPPIVFSASSSNSMKAPVACSDADHVLPMLSTSGPLPRRRGRDVVEQVRPRDDLELHLHAGLLRELRDRLASRIFLSWIDRRALVGGPVLDRLALEPAAAVRSRRPRPPGREAASSSRRGDPPH